MTTPWPPSPTPQPQDPELAERYRRDAMQQRETQRAESARLAAETPPSRTPKGPILVIAALITLALVALTGLTLLGPMLRQSETRDEVLPASTTQLRVENDVGRVRVRQADAGEAPRVSLATEWGLRRPTTSVTTSGERTTLKGDCTSSVTTVCRTDWLVVVPKNTDLMIKQGAGEVTLEAPDGGVDVQAGAGSVTVSEATSREVSVELGAGNLDYEGVKPPERVDVTLGVGDANLQLPDTVPYRISTSGGATEVVNRLGHDASAQRRISVEVGIGDVTLRAS